MPNGMRSTGTRRGGSGRDRKHRQIERTRAMRGFEDFLREIGAGAAAVGAARAAAEVGERPHARLGGFADRALGDGIADADVHGAYLIANANDCQQVPYRSRTSDPARTARLSASRCLQW